MGAKILAIIFLTPLFGFGLQYVKELFKAFAIYRESKKAKPDDKWKFEFPKN